MPTRPIAAKLKLTGSGLTERLAVYRLSVKGGRIATVTESAIANVIVIGIGIANAALVLSATMTATVVIVRRSASASTALVVILVAVGTNSTTAPTRVAPSATTAAAGATVMPRVLPAGPPSGIDATVAREIAAEAPEENETVGSGRLRLKKRRRKRPCILAARRAKSKRSKAGLRR